MTEPREPVWLDRRRVVAIHGEQINDHGGASGTRDEGLLESALARPMNHFAYTGASVPELAAVYALAIARNHPFIDGNKRTAYVALELFLDLNGYDFVASDARSVVSMLAMAAGEMSDEEFIAWVGADARRRE
jgi:death-on-curing protein